MIKSLDMSENNNSKEKLKIEIDENNREEIQEDSNSEKDKESIKENSEIVKEEKQKEQKNEESKQKTEENPKLNKDEEHKPKKLDFANLINENLKKKDNIIAPKKTESKPSGFGEERKKFLEMINNKNKKPDNNNPKIPKPLNKVSNSIIEKINLRKQKKVMKSL